MFNFSLKLIRWSNEEFNASNKNETMKRLTQRNAMLRVFSSVFKYVQMFKKINYEKHEVCEIFFSVKEVWGSR
jgi:hypothetical protein